MPKGKLFCFSPPVMLATFLFEVGAAAYVLWRYKLNQLTRLVVVLLLALATFQAAEYMICGGYGLSATAWSRIGFVAITLLPPLGLHIVVALAKQKQTVLVAAAYASAVGYIAYFTFAQSAFSGQQCLGNYVIFQLTPSASWLFTFFYFGWLGVGIWLSLRYADQTNSKKLKAALRWFAAGYAAFIIPTVVANITSPSTLRGVPSIMCGFAVLLALIVTFAVVPQVDKVKRKRNNKR